MNCEEFEAIGLDAERDASVREAEWAAAREHASTCSRCAALQDSWQVARIQLSALAEDTDLAQAPARVEMRLRQEFRTRHRTLKVRRAAVIAAWALASAAVLMGAVSWRNWRAGQREEAAKHANSQQMAIAAAGNHQSLAPHSTASEDSLVADNEMNDFTLLPGVLPAETDDAAIVRVRMQRSTLGALGLPVNEDRAGEWIQVDLLVGNDGLPQAVRLLQ
jgi:hypothetical protein